jgi:hypothetical protein
MSLTGDDCPSQCSFTSCQAMAQRQPFVLLTCHPAHPASWAGPAFHSLRVPPYLLTPIDILRASTINVADVRARGLCEGHSANDFAGPPFGCHASAAWRAAWAPTMGWGACCTYENWTYAGAAYAVGRDGRRYMQLFVR